jgi:hypothetical protein
MDGRLHRVGDRFWKGKLHGYHVHIGKQGDSWSVWLMPGGQWTERCLRVGSLAEGAKLARAWIEERGKKNSQASGGAVLSIDQRGIGPPRRNEPRVCYCACELRCRSVLTLRKNEYQSSRSQGPR